MHAGALRRCGVIMREREQAARRELCSGPVVADSPEASAALAAVWRRLLAWRAALGGWEAPASPEPPARFLPACRGHELLRPSGHTAPLCVRCGLFRRSRGIDTRCRPRVPEVLGREQSRPSLLAAAMDLAAPRGRGRQPPACARSWRRSHSERPP